MDVVGKLNALAERVREKIKKKGEARLSLFILALYCTTLPADIIER